MALLHASAGHRWDRTSAPESCQYVSSDRVGAFLHAFPRRPSARTLPGDQGDNGAVGVSRQRPAVAVRERRSRLGGGCTALLSCPLTSHHTEILHGPTRGWRTRYLPHGQYGSTGGSTFSVPTHTATALILHMNRCLMKNNVGRQHHLPPHNMSNQGASRSLDTVSASHSPLVPRGQILMINAQPQSLTPERWQAQVKGRRWPNFRCRGTVRRLEPYPPYRNGMPCSLGITVVSACSQASRLKATTLSGRLICHSQPMSPTTMHFRRSLRTLALRLCQLYRRLRPRPR